MPQKWNLQDIKPAGTPRPSAPRPSATRVHADIAPRPTRVQEKRTFSDPDLATIDVIDGNATKRRRVMVTSVLAVFLLVFGFSLNVFLGGAKVTVYPKVKEVSVQSDFTAYTVPQAGDLSYELLTLSATAEKQVQAAGKEEVTEQARGKIFVYNLQTNAPQRLITNTRFESPDGKIFRIKDSIEVPRATTDADGTVIPGKVVADVFADNPGEEYNINPARFTVPGLKDSEQYDKVYGESTTAFTGGFQGEKYIIDESELQTAQQELHVELRNMLLTQLKEKIPAGFIVYDDAVTFVYESLPATEYGESLATIKEEARLHVPLFNAEQFGAFIAEKSVPDYNDEPVYILEPKNLVFNYTDPLTAQADISTYENLDFTLKGSAKVVWNLDVNALKNDLLNIEKNQAATVFANYRSIGNAQAEVRPFWASSFPEKPEQIEIVPIIK